MIATALRHGVAPRAEIADARGVEYYLELGVRHFCAGHDVGILHNWFSEQGARMRSLLGQLSAAPAPPRPGAGRAAGEAATAPHRDGPTATEDDKAPSRTDSKAPY